MAAYLSTELGGSANQTSAPVGYKPNATTYGGRIRSIRASFTLASQATTDTLVIGNLPAGSTFAGGLLHSDTSLGATATLAIGIAGATGKYRTAATFTSTNTPTDFGNTAAVVEDATTAERQVIGTIAAAALPASGNLCIEIFYRMP